MATYNVYLQNRLTEIEVIITGLFQKNEFSIDNLMYILFSIEELNLYKQISSETNMEIYTKINDLLEIGCELLNQKIYLDVKANELNKKFCNTSINLEFKTDLIKLYNSFIARGNFYLEIFLRKLNCYIANSLGESNYDIKIKLNQLQSLKKDFEQLENNFKLLIESNFSSLKTLKSKCVDMELTIYEIGLFYSIVVSSCFSFYLNISSIDDYILKKSLYGFNSISLLSIENVKIPFLKEFVESENILVMFVTMTDILNQFIVLKQIKTTLSCDANSSIKRYRFISEMDSFNISSFDNLYLIDIDFMLED